MMTLAAAPYPVLRRSAMATGLVFALSGLVQASWVSRLPEVRTRLHADPGSLGLALLGIAVGSILATPMTGRLVRRFGSRTVVAASCGLSTLALVGASLVQSVVELGLVLFVFGIGYGSWDVAMNIHGHGVEASAGKAWMPRYHAAWSVGSFLGAGLGALAVAIGVPVAAHFSVASAGVFAAVLGLLMLFLADDDATSDSELDDAASAARQEQRAGRLFSLSLLLLGVVLGCSTLIEGAASDWLAIYFDDVRHVTPAAGAAAFTTFAVAMAASRGAGTWTINWLGRAGAVRASSAVALVGVGMLLLSPVVALAYVGAALWGLGTAIVFPAVISAAGDTPGRSAEAISMVAPIGYSGFLLGPPLIGLLARSIGIGHALWVVGGLAAIMVAFAGATRERQRDEAMP